MINLISSCKVNIIIFYDANYQKYKVGLLLSASSLLMSVKVIVKQLGNHFNIGTIILVVLYACYPVAQIPHLFFAVLFLTMMLYDVSKF